MRFEYSILTALATFAAVQAQDVEQSNIPQQCREVCAPTITMSERCDREDNEFIPCICSSPEVSTVPQCEACVNLYDNSNDNDVNDYRTSCGLPTATYTAGAAATSATGGAATTISSSVASVTSSASSAGNSVSSSVSSQVNSVSSSVSSLVNSVTSSVSSAATQPTGGAAAMAPAVGGAAAVALLGLAGLL